MVTVIKGNRREVPPDIPIMAWWDKVQEYRSWPELVTLPWWVPELEYLTPGELITMRAKAMVWRDVTGALPRDVSCWWEVRMARRRGDLPPSEEWVGVVIDAQGVLHCGKCRARWSPNTDGSDFPERCKLCGAGWRR